MPPLSPLAKCALRLAERGMAVFPCWPRAKEPATPHGHKDASTDPAVIERWWRREPAYNIAIATGAISGIFVVDIDGLEAEAALRKLGELPSTVEAITGRAGGRHVWLRWPGRPVSNSADQIAAGVDVRGDCGYVLAPPSMHPSGRRYVWSVDSAPTIAYAPGWLLKLIDEPCSADNDDGTTPAQWATFLATRADGSRREAAIARFYGLLVRRFIDPWIALDTVRMFNELRCDPPLDDSEVVRIADNIAAREVSRRERLL